MLNLKTTIKTIQAELKPTYAFTGGNTLVGLTGAMVLLPGTDYDDLLQHATGMHSMLEQWDTMQAITNLWGAERRTVYIDTEGRDVCARSDAHAQEVRITDHPRKHNLAGWFRKDLMALIPARVSLRVTPYANRYAIVLPDIVVLPLRW